MNQFDKFFQYLFKVLCYCNDIYLNLNLNKIYQLVLKNCSYLLFSINILNLFEKTFDIHMLKQ